MKPIKLISVKLTGKKPVTLSKKQSQKVLQGKARIKISSDPNANKGNITINRIKPMALSR